MEEKHASDYNGAVSWFMRASRLAVAVAIIKSRPSEGVRRFTESLAETVKQQDKSWRCKARALQEDVLRLRQQLLLTSLLLKAERRVTPAAGHEVVGQLSQDDTQRLQTEGQSDSGYVLDISSHGTQGLCLPLTPPNSQNVLVQGREWRQDCGLVKHMQFLQCLSGLRRRYEPSLCLGDDDDVVWDSVVQLLDCVLEVFRRAHVGQPVHHPELLRHAAQVVEQTLSQKTTDVQRFSRVEDLLKEMICLLLTGHQLNEFSVKGLLSECLMTLGGSRVIRPALVKLLMSQMIQMAQHLWDACQTCRDHQVDWIRYENSFYVFWLLEHLATDADNHVDQELITQLENGAFALSDEFPLFSLYMWRIGGLFRTAHTRADSRPQPVVPNQTECF